MELLSVAKGDKIDKLVPSVPVLKVNLPDVGDVVAQLLEIFLLIFVQQSIYKKIRYFS